MKPLSRESVDEIREHFAFTDTDGNGRIDFKEFARLLKVLSPNSTTEQAAEGFSMIDENSDGHIDFEEFLAWWKTVWWEF